MSPTLLTPPRTARGAEHERCGLDTIVALPRIVALSGSPSPDSKTAMVVRQVLDDLRAAGHATHLLRLSDLDAGALLRGDSAEPGIAQAVAALDAADGVIVATPIFKASCSGLLKVFLDLLPQFALAGKTVLPLATGGSPPMCWRSTTACVRSCSRWGRATSCRPCSWPPANCPS